MKKKACLFIIMLCIFWTQAVQASAAEAPPPKVEAKSAIVIDGDTGKVLYGKDIHTKREPASITKIMTCLLALERLDLDQEIVITGEVETMGNVINLQEGERITVKNLLYALMVHSANDAAEVIAKEISGSNQAFGDLMTIRARECGAKNTRFLNPNGLNWPGQEKHLTTAYDMAMIAKTAMQNKTFRQLVSTVNYTIPATNKFGERKLRSTNLSLWDTKSKIVVNGHKRSPKYEGSLGIKTGLTSTAGACFVGEIDRNGTNLISVVLFSGELTRYSDSIAMWNYCLNKYYDTHKLVKKGEELEKVRVKRGAHRKVMAIAEKDAAATIPKGESTENLKTEFVPDHVEAPVKKGQSIGTVQVYNDEVLVSQSRVLAAESVERGGPLSVIGIPDWLALVIYLFIGTLILAVIVMKLLQRKAQKRRAKREMQKQRAKQRAQQRRKQ